MDIKDKVAVVTGASRGIGEAVAVRLAGAGADLVLAARTEEDLEQTKQRVEDAGGEAIVVVADVTKASDIEKIYDAAEKEFRKVDIVINNAGVVKRLPLKNTEEETYEWMMDVNVRGVFLSCREALRRLDEGVILNISSNAGMHGIANLSVYCATKFAVNGLTESIAGEWEGRIYAVCPGPVNTDMQSTTSEEKRRKMDQPDDIADRVVKIIESPEKYGSGSAIDVWNKLS